MFDRPEDVRQNRLLAALPEADLACVQSQLVPAHLTTGETLVQASGWAFCLKRHRPPSSDLTTTHEHIANTLGVRRESVTGAADNLQHLGLVRNSRGHVTVVDRAGRESRSCECCRVVRREYDRLLRVVGPNEEPGS